MKRGQFWRNNWLKKKLNSKSKSTQSKVVGTKVSLQLYDDNHFQANTINNPEIIQIFESLPHKKVKREAVKGGAYASNWLFPIEQYNTLIDKLSRLNVNLIKVPKEVLNIVKKYPTFDTEGSFDFSGMPIELMKNLLNFQWTSVKFALTRGGKCMIADDMGLGKTIQAISIASCYRTEWPLLIIVPSSVCPQWKKELIRWLPEYKDDINLIKTGKDEVDSLINVMSYALVSALEQKILEKKFNVIICDESHYIKSEAAQRTQCLIPILKKAERRILLTGTPALSRPIELYCQLEALDAQIFPSMHEFGMRYCAAFQGTRGWDYTGSSNLNELFYVLRRTVMIRRMKDDVISELPTKRRHFVKIAVEEEDKEIVHKCLEKLNKNGQFLNKAWSEKFIERADAQKRAAITHYYMESGRSKAKSATNFLIEKLRELENEKILIFAHHTDVLDSIGEMLTTHGISYLRVDGKTAQKQKEDRIAAFTGNRYIRIFLLSITCAGVGLNLVAASVVIFAELYWTPGSLIQAEDRAHRIGQKRDVHIYYLLAEGTIDDLIWPMISKKLAVVGRSLNGAIQTMATEGATHDDRTINTIFGHSDLNDDPLDEDFEQDKVIFSKKENKNKKRKISESKESKGSNKKRKLEDKAVENKRISIDLADEKRYQDIIEYSNSQPVTPRRSPEKTKNKKDKSRFQPLNITSAPMIEEKQKKRQLDITNCFQKLEPPKKKRKKSHSLSQIVVSHSSKKDSSNKSSLNITVVLDSDSDRDDIIPKVISHKDIDSVGSKITRTSSMIDIRQIKNTKDKKKKIGKLTIVMDNDLKKNDKKNKNNNKNTTVNNEKEIMKNRLMRTMSMSEKSKDYEKKSHLDKCEINHKNGKKKTIEAQLDKQLEIKKKNTDQVLSKKSNKETTKKKDNHKGKPTKNKSNNKDKSTKNENKKSNNKDKKKKKYKTKDNESHKPDNMDFYSDNFLTMNNNMVLKNILQNMEDKQYDDEDEIHQSKDKIQNNKEKHNDTLHQSKDKKQNNKQKQKDKAHNKKQHEDDIHNNEEKRKDKVKVHNNDKDQNKDEIHINKKEKRKNKTQNNKEKHEGKTHCKKTG